MKLFELNLTLLRECEELEDLFDLLNYMIIKGPNHVTVNLKNSNGTYFIKIYLYRCLSEPSIGIKQDLYISSDDADKVLSTLKEINFKKTFLKFNLVNSQIITIEAFDKPYEYEYKVLDVKELADIYSFWKNSDFDELFNLSFNIRKPFDELQYLVQIINKMMTNEVYSYLSVENRGGSFESQTKKRLRFNFFTVNYRRPSLFVNCNIHNWKEQNLSKYNMLLSSYSSPIRVFYELQNKNKRNGPIITVRFYVLKKSIEYGEILKKCQILDYLQ